MSVLTKIPVDVRGREWIRQLDVEAARRSSPASGAPDGQGVEKREAGNAVGDGGGVATQASGAAG